MRTEILIDSDCLVVGPDFLLLDRADGSFEMYRLEDDERQRLDHRLQIMRAVDAWRKERRAA